MQSTGVIIRNRNDGAEYGMHAECADSVLATVAAALGVTPAALGDDMPLVIVGPLFADASEWTCAAADCTHV